MKFGDIEDAFNFVSAHRQYEASAYVSLETGETYWISDNMDEDERPDDLYESENYAEIPHKNDLNLGKDLVFRFVRGNLPDRIDEVRGIFSRRGAYGRFKSLLERKGFLDRWHEFEAKETERALREWCRDLGIELTVEE